MTRRLLPTALLVLLVALLFTGCQNAVGTTPGGNTTPGVTYATATSVSGTVASTPVSAVMEGYGMLAANNGGVTLTPAVDSSTGAFSANLPTPTSTTAADTLCAGATVTPSALTVSIFDGLAATIGTPSSNTEIGGFYYADAAQDPASGSVSVTAWVYANADGSIHGSCTYNSVPTTFKLDLKQGWNTATETLAVTYSSSTGNYTPTGVTLTTAAPSSKAQWYFQAQPSILKQVYAPVSNVTNTAAQAIITPYAPDGTTQTDTSPTSYLYVDSGGNYVIDEHLPSPSNFPTPAITASDAFMCTGGTQVPSTVTYNAVGEFKYQDNTGAPQAIHDKSPSGTNILYFVYASAPTHFDATCTDPTTGFPITVTANLNTGWNTMAATVDTTNNKITIANATSQAGYTWQSASVN